MPATPAPTPTPAIDWTQLDDFRAVVDTYVASMPDQLIAQHDELVTLYRQAFAERGVDLTDELTIFLFGMVASTTGSLIIELTREQCSAGDEHVEHVESHVRIGLVRLGLIWRDAVKRLERTADLALPAEAEVLSLLDFEPDVDDETTAG